VKDWTEQLLTAAATLGVVLVFILGVYRPRHRTLEDLRAQVQGLEQKMAQTQEQCSVLMPLTRQVEQLRASAGRFEQCLPRDGQVGPFLQQVAEQLREAHLSSLEIRPGSPAQGPRYTELPIRMGFSGRFSNIFAFLAELEGMSRTKRIVDLSLTGDLGNVENVRADLVLSIYCTKG
jgi:Tfp pilus assembly protein PilO